MSFRGQQHGQRVYTGKGFDNKNDQRFRELEPVPARPYDAVTDVACQQVGVPYSQVFVGGQPDHVRSHEKHIENKDRRGFIDRDVLNNERRIKRKAREWSQKYDRGNRTRERAREMRRGLLA